MTNEEKANDDNNPMAQVYATLAVADAINNLADVIKEATGDLGYAIDELGISLSPDPEEE